MKVFTPTTSSHSPDNLWKHIGQGAKEAGGRWNSVGTTMVYTSEAPSVLADIDD